MNEEIRGQERKGHLKRNIKPFLAGAGTVIAVLAAAWLVKQAVWIPGGTDTPTSFQTDTKIRLIEGLIDDVYVGKRMRKRWRRKCTED